MNRVFPLTALLLALFCIASRSARGQNDWQFPDPHFGIVEFGPGHPGPATERQYRDEIGPPGRYSAPGLQRPRNQPQPPRPRLLKPRARRSR